MGKKEKDQGKDKHCKREADGEPETTTNEDNTVALRREKKRQRREEKERLEKLVPKKDENGIMYTKQQLRRMRKRVARGLDPIETEQEKQERLARDAELRREEQAELEGMLNDREGASESDDGDNNNDGDDDAGNKDEEENDNSSQASSKEDSGEEATLPTPQPIPHKNKPSRKKPVPSDYVCSACQNKGLHWIYDCPNKITMPGSNQKSKKQRGVHNPDPRKVFVSGLPFDAKHADVKKLFAPCGPLLHIKVIEFPDTGRCKGQALVTFKTIEGTQKALTMNGTTIENNVATEKKGPSSETKRKDLKLTVTKALNRVASKAKRRNKSR
jgi:hypothetical protein